MLFVESRFIFAAILFVQGAQAVRDKRGDAVRRGVPIGERLTKGKTWKFETTERQPARVAAVNSDGAVKNVNAVTPDAPAKRQKRRGRVTEDAGLARVV